MVLCIIMDSFLWLKNYRLNEKDPSPIMASQWRLFHTRALADSAVLVSLILSLAFFQYSWSLYIDPVASLFIVGVLLFSGTRVVRTSPPDLLDRTLDEELQMVIVRHLAQFFNDYPELHGVRSRRSGSSVYIEIFLEFDGGKRMCEVQQVIDRIKMSIETQIPKRTVSIVPTSTAVCRTDTEGSGK